MKTALLLVLLVAGTFAVESSTEFTEFMNIDKSEFGKTLMDTIQVQLESKAPIDGLVKQLAYIENQLTDDQRKADQSHQAFQDKCDEEIKYLEDDIAKTKQKAADLENEIDIKTELLNQKRKRRADLQAQARKIKGDIAAAVAQRKKEAREFDVRVQEHQYASYVVNQAKRIFDKTFSKRSFLQVNSDATFTEITKHFEKYTSETSFKHNTHYASLFKIYSQITASNVLRSDKGMVGRIYRLFDETLAKIEDSLTNERRAEDKRIQIYKKYRHALERELSQVNRDISNLNVQILALENRLKEAKQELAEAIQRIHLKERELEDKIKECDDEAEAYKTDREKRDEKKNIVSTLIGLIQSKLRKLRAYSRKRSQ